MLSVGECLEGGFMRFNLRKLQATYDFFCKLLSTHNYARKSRPFNIKHRDELIEKIEICIDLMDVELRDRKENKRD